MIGGHVSLHRSGTQHVGLCPFHAEKTPSFSVSQQRQAWYCHGCHEGGDIFTFVEKIEGVDFPRALELLAERAGVELEKDRRGGARGAGRRRSIELNERAAKFYEYVLWNLAAGGAGTPSAGGARRRRGAGPALPGGFRPPGRPGGRCPVALPGRTWGGGPLRGRRRRTGRPGRARPLPSPSRLPHLRRARTGARVRRRGPWATPPPSTSTPRRPAPTTSRWPSSGWTRPGRRCGSGGWPWWSRATSTCSPPMPRGSPTWSPRAARR